MTGLSNSRVTHSSARRQPRVLALAGVLVLLAALLAGCGQEDPTAIVQVTATRSLAVGATANPPGGTATLSPTTAAATATAPAAATAAPTAGDDDSDLMPEVAPSDQAMPEMTPGAGGLPGADGAGTPGAGGVPPEVTSALGGLIPEVAVGEGEVELEDFQFNPRILTVRAGTTVKFSNKDDVIHTVTSDTGLFDSGDLAKGQEWEYTFAEPGEYPYYCLPHGGPGGAGMSGVILVVP